MKPATLVFAFSFLFCSSFSLASVESASLPENATNNDNVEHQSEIKASDELESEKDFRDSKEYQSEIVQSYAEIENEDLAERADVKDQAPNEAVVEESNSFLQTKMPGEEIDFKLKLHKSNLHFVEGRASSDIGKVLFKSRLMPSNEVKLSLTMKQREVDDVQLVGYFDLANFTMELDGSNAVLNKDHKELIHVLNQHLRSQFEVAYRDYDFPEHAFMLVQMLSYWAVSPEGYVHEKREIVANY